MPYRWLGQTGQAVSLLGLGGQHIGQRWLSERKAIEIMRTAVDEGVNFFDNAWYYNGGQSEERMGKALRDGYREQVFLMTKVLTREPAAAQSELEDSLRRLGTDRIDLWQFHEVIRPEDPRRIYEEGLIDVALRARDVGKIRFIGFTGHLSPAVHIEMIARGYPWDCVQMPLNVYDQHFRSFARTVLPEARNRQIGVIAMKVMGGTPGVLPMTGVVSPAECLRYSMNLPVSTVLSGMDSLDRLRHNINVAKAFTPLEPAEVNALFERTRRQGRTGHCEPYKTVWHRDLMKFLVWNALTRAVNWAFGRKPG